MIKDISNGNNMRYTINERATLVGQLLPNSVVKIELLNLTTDTLISLDNNTCIESTQLNGIYLWDTSNITTNTITGYTNILYKMYNVNNETDIYYGKIVLGGYVDDNNSVNIDSVITDLTEVLDTLNIINMRL